MLTPLIHTDEMPRKKESQTNFDMHAACVPGTSSIGKVCPNSHSMSTSQVHRHTMHRHNHLAVPSLAKL